MIIGNDSLPDSSNSLSSVASQADSGCLPLSTLE
jgi:hypothetical protein